MKKSAILKLRYILVGLLLALPATANEGSEAPPPEPEPWYCDWFGISCRTLTTGDLGDTGDGKEPPK